MIVEGKLFQRPGQFLVQQHRLILVQQQDNVIFVYHRHAVGIGFPQRRHLPLVEQFTVMGFGTVQDGQTEKFSQMMVQNPETGLHHLQVAEASLDQLVKKGFILQTGSLDEKIVLLHFHRTDIGQRGGQTQFMFAGFRPVRETHRHITGHDMLDPDRAEDPVGIRMILCPDKECLVVLVNLIFNL